MEGEFFVCWFGFVFWSGGAGKGRISFLFGTGIFWGGDLFLFLVPYLMEKHILILRTCM